MKSNQGITVLQIIDGKARPAPEELRETGKPFSGMKKEYGNPEATTVDEKSDQDNLRARIAKTWRELSKLKKGVIIGGTILTILLITFFTLLIISLTVKPKIEMRYRESVPLPNNEKMSYYDITAEKQSILDKKKASFSMVTITPKESRLLQQGDDLNTVVLQFSYPDAGVDILMISADDMTLRVDYDQLLEYYSEQNQGNRRLLFQMELRSITRSLQDIGEDNSFTFDNPTNIRVDAEASLLKAYAAPTGSDVSDLEIRYIETVDVLNEGGVNVIVPNEKSSRLLHALRNMQGEWQGIFDEINTAVTQAKINEANEAMKSFVPQTEEEFNKADGSEFINVLKNSNFNPANEVLVEEEVAEVVRLLQNVETTNTDAVVAPAKETDSSTSKDSKSPEGSKDSSDSKDSKGIKDTKDSKDANDSKETKDTKETKPKRDGNAKKPNRKTRPISRGRRSSAAAKKTKKISKGAQMSSKCTSTGRGKVKRCEKAATEEKTSGFKVEKQQNDKKGANRKACYEVRKKEKNEASVQKKTKNGNLNKEIEKAKPDTQPTISPAKPPKQTTQTTPTTTDIPEAKPAPTPASSPVPGPAQPSTSTTTTPTSPTTP